MLTRGDEALTSCGNNSHLRPHITEYGKGDCRVELFPQKYILALMSPGSQPARYWRKPNTAWINEPPDPTCAQEWPPSPHAA